MNENRPHHDESAPDRDALRSLLRDADPAADGAGLDAVQRAHMRQAIIETAYGRAGDGLWSAAWQGGGRPALAAAALITVVGLALWTLDRNPESPPGEIADAGMTVPKPGPATTPGASSSVPETEPTATLASPPETAPTATLASQPDSPPTATVASQPENTTVAGVDHTSPPDRQARTMQFIAPRGTRIIWILDPNFESPIAGREARQEQAR